jgi:hypothetical protein
MRRPSVPARRPHLRVEELEARFLLAADPTGVTRPFAQVFVDNAYYDLFRRAPDDAGFVYWQNLMAQGQTRGQVALGFTSSPEYQTKLVGSLYHFYLGRAADATGLSFWVGALKAGATDEQVKAGILSSDEFFQKSGGSDAGFLSALYQDVLGRAGDASGQAFFNLELAQGKSRTTVAGQVVGSTEGLQDLVSGYYQQFLGRAGDAGGVNAWASAIQTGLTDEQVAAQFLASDEYATLLTQARGDAITDWHDILSGAIRTDKSAPPQAARAIAMVGAAVYDAVEPVEGLYPLYNPNNAISGLPATALPGTSQEAAAVEAAYTVLVGLFPAQKATFDQDLATSLAAIPSGVGKTDGAVLGVTVGNAILAWRSNDGSNTTVTYTPGTGPGQWQPTPPAFAAAVDPQWPNVTPFTMTSAGSFSRPARCRSTAPPTPPPSIRPSRSAPSTAPRGRPCKPRLPSSGPTPAARRRPPATGTRSPKGWPCSKAAPSARRRARSPWWTSPWATPSLSPGTPSTPTTAGGRSPRSATPT